MTSRPAWTFLTAGPVPAGQLATVTAHATAMKRILLGSLVAAIVLFAFGGAFWTCPIPYAYVEKPTTSGAALASALREHLPNDGLYLVPGMDTDPAKSQEQYRKGPVATIHYRREGVEPMSPAVLTTGFFHGWITTALLAVLLRIAALPRFGQRWTVVTLAGVACANYMTLGDGIYWFQPWPWLILNAAYNSAAMLVAGLVLAAFIKPTTSKAAPNAAPPASPAP